MRWRKKRAWHFQLIKMIAFAGHSIDNIGENGTGLIECKRKKGCAYIVV